MKHFAEKHKFVSSILWGVDRTGCEGFYIKRFSFSRFGRIRTMDGHEPSEFGYYIGKEFLTSPNLFQTREEAAEVAAHISSGSEDNLEIFGVMKASTMGGTFRAKPVGPFFSFGERL